MSLIASTGGPAGAFAATASAELCEIWEPAPPPGGVLSVPEEAASAASSAETAAEAEVWAEVVAEPEARAPSPDISPVPDIGAPSAVDSTPSSPPEPTAAPWLVGPVGPSPSAGSAPMPEPAEAA